MADSSAGHGTPDMAGASTGSTTTTLIGGVAADDSSAPAVHSEVAATTTSTDQCSNRLSQTDVHAPGEPTTAVWCTNSSTDGNGTDSGQQNGDPEAAGWLHGTADENDAPGRTSSSTVGDDDVDITDATAGPQRPQFAMEHNPAVVHVSHDVDAVPGKAQDAIHDPDHLSPPTEADDDDGNAQPQPLLIVTTDDNAMPGRKEPRKARQEIGRLVFGASHLWVPGERETEPISPGEAVARTAVMVLRRRSLLSMNTDDLPDAPCAAETSHQSSEESSAAAAQPEDAAEPASDTSVPPPLERTDYFRTDDASRPPLVPPLVPSSLSSTVSRSSQSSHSVSSEVASSVSVTSSRESRRVVVLPNEMPKDALDRVMQTKDLKLLGEYFGARGEFYMDMLREFLCSYDFVGVSIDYALRQFLSGFVLPVESQQIDRIMQQFALRFHETNPTLFQSSDTVYVLSFAIIMLNTDMYNPSVKNRMTKQQFFKNNRGIDKGKDIPERLLEKVYDSIRSEQIRYPGDDAYTADSQLVEAQGVLAKAGNIAATLSRKLGSKRQSVGPDLATLFAGGKTMANRLSRRLSITPETIAAASAAAAVASSAPTVPSNTTPSVTMTNSANTLSQNSLSLANQTDGPTLRPSNELPSEATTETTNAGLKRSDSAPDVSKMCESGRAAGDELGASSLNKGELTEVAEEPSSLTRSPSLLSRLVTNEGREGLLCKKNDLESDGKRSTRRSWRLVYAILEVANLTLYKADTQHWSSNNSGGLPTSPRSPRPELTHIMEIPLENAFAFVEYGHRGRAHVLRLVTARKSAYLFQGVSVNDINLWIQAINKAAVHSTTFGEETTTREDKVVAIGKRIDTLEKRIKVEAAYRDGINKLVDGHKAFANPSAEAEAMAQYSRWEKVMQELSDELRRLRCYQSILTRRRSLGAPLSTPLNAPDKATGRDSIDTNVSLQDGPVVVVQMVPPL